MVVGDRAAKAEEIRQAINDCVMRKRATRSDMDNAEQTRKRAAKYREDGERLLRQADDMLARVERGQELLEREDAEIRRLRTELEALGQIVVVDKVKRAADALADIDADALAALAAERPDLLPMLELVRGKAVTSA